MINLSKYFCLLSILILIGCNSQNDKLFQEINSDISGIDFANNLVDTEEQNIIQNLYHYNGGGVAIGDINNDTLPDIYLSSNQGPNKLFLNQGNFRFEDISDTALPSYQEDWSTGVTMADVNNDGWLDIYTSCLTNYKGYKGQNRLLINNGDLSFRDASEESGLSLEVYGTQAAFFDYDRDGDLDMYMLCHSFKKASVFQDTSVRELVDTLAGDRLMRNLLSETGELRFEDVTQSSGIYSSQVGFGLGISISDINDDGWSDIFVGNDFHENDYVYLNNRDGTFSERSKELIAHGSTFSMGNDIADINNDGLKDIMTLDMKPADYSIFKKSSGIDDYIIYRYKLNFGYNPQYAQNCLLLNRGNNNWTDVANVTGLAATDWSWSVLMDDFDQDGRKDVFISNGIVTRPNDMDYLDYISSEVAQTQASDQQLIDAMPSGKWTNYFFHNQDSLRFSNATDTWTDLTPDWTTGAAVADLDLDGDLDIVGNRINQSALILRNDAKGKNYLTIDVDPTNRSKFLGAQIWAWIEGNPIYKEIKSNRGFQSSSETIGHFGLGSNVLVDSLIIHWPNGNQQYLTNVKANQRLFIKPTNNNNTRRENCEVFDIVELNASHNENDYTDFRDEALLPWSLATEGPATAIGDVDSDGIEDLYIGSARGYPDKLYFGMENGKFSLSENSIPLDSRSYEATDAILIDVDNDGDLDLFIATGGNEFSSSNLNLTERLFINDGQGIFKEESNRLPEIALNSSCAKAVDFDKDGDIDLFVGARSVTHQYGLPPTSYVFVNNGDGIFNTDPVIPMDLGMVNDALWEDLNNDGRPDLVVASEWQDIQIILNRTDGFAKSMISRSQGIWRSLAIADLNGDGIKDIVAGNIGLNLPINASFKEPLTLFIDDFNQNGSTEPILANYINGRLFPYENRGKLGSQIPSLKRRYLDNATFAQADMYALLKDHANEPLKLKAELLTSMIYFGQGENRYHGVPLPVEAQYSCVNAIAIDDFNKDGNIDILTGGNLYEVAPSLGTLDGSYIDLFVGNGQGSFQVTTCNPVKGVNGQVRNFNRLSDDRLLIGLNNEKCKVINF